MSDTPEQDEVTVVVNIPALLMREIGRVITAYAHLEWRLTLITYDLLSVERVEGRIAVREPRLTDHLTMIKDLMEVKGIKTDVDTVTLMEAAQAAMSQRHRLAHGIWCRNPKHPGKLFLRLTRGQWQHSPNQKGKTKRVIFPEAVEYDIRDCKSLRNLIEGVTDTCYELGWDVYNALRDLEEESHEPPPMPYRPRDRS